MKTNSISDKRILVTLSRPYRIVLIIAFISSVTGMVIDLAGYLKNQYDFLSALNIISLLIYFVALAGFLSRKLDLRRSAIILIYTMVINILASNIFSSLNNLPDWPFNFLRGTLVIAVFISISGLILHKGFLIGINLLYSFTAGVIWWVSEKNFVSSNILFFIILLSAFSYAIVLFMEKLRRSLLENRQLQQKLYLRDREVLEKDNELVRERALRLQETLALRNRELMSHALLLAQQVENQTRIYDKLYKLLNRLDAEAEKE